MTQILRKCTTLSAIYGSISKWSTFWNPRGSFRPLLPRSPAKSIKLPNVSLKWRLPAKIVNADPLGTGLRNFNSSSRWRALLGGIWIILLPFPLGMKLMGELGLEQYIPRMWGVNGIGSVLGSSLAIILAISVGFSYSMKLGAFLYFLIVLLFSMGFLFSKTSNSSLSQSHQTK